MKTENILVIVALIVSLVVLHIVRTGPIVELPNGQIRGRRGRTFQGTTYYAFEKVPYAAPPIGKLRFKPPQPPQTWEGVRETVGRDVSCYQQSINDNFETEDCLFAFIYTTVLPTDRSNNTLLPVMFFIHGGGFYLDSSMNLQPENLLDNGVVVVTIKYRLGPFGFLSTQDTVIPGNNGLKDQQVALKWVYKNIHLFGGDPSKITIFGQSAGSVSVTYQLLNKKNEGLIAGAICQSGTFLSPWSYQRRAREIAFATAAILNDTFLTNNNSQDLLEYLQSVSAEDLDAAADKYREREGPEDFQLSQGYYYAPIVEKKNPDAFVTEKMYSLLKKGNFIKVPVLIGINSEEMLFMCQDSEATKETMIAYDRHPDWLVPNDMLIMDHNKRTEIGLAIKNLYTGGQPLANNLELDITATTPSQDPLSNTQNLRLILHPYISINSPMMAKLVAMILDMMKLNMFRTM